MYYDDDDCRGSIQLCIILLCLINLGNDSIWFGEDALKWLEGGRESNQ